MVTLFGFILPPLPSEVNIPQKRSLTGLQDRYQTFGIVIINRSYLENSSNTGCKLFSVFKTRVALTQLPRIH
jgi:hypothetical protein